MGDQSIVDKTMRSVFVGNIPYEVSEEKLKDIFSEVGPVLSFKLVFDRDSGKPKGYGFCEYKDQETALSAMRNLNNYEIAGRNLRVDNACTEKTRLEMQSLMQSTQVESTYGESISPEKAPEAISKAVASLPPEKMYELMKQMNHCIQNNPTESRQLLLQNPQLAYALLQVMVVMKVVDPSAALGMLHPANVAPPVLTLSTTAPSTVVNNTTSTSSSFSETRPVSSSDPQTSVWNNVNSKPPGPITSMSSIQPPPLPPMVSSQDMDMRTPDLSTTNRFNDQDFRIPPMPSFIQPEMFRRDPRLQNQQLPDNMDTRKAFPVLVPPPGMIPPPNLPIGLMQPVPGGIPGLPPNMPIMMPPPPPGPLPTHSRPSQPTSGSSSVPVTSVGGVNPSVSTIDDSDKEKVELIRKVLLLTDEHIAMLPDKQQRSIMVLKQQIARSA